MRRFLRRTFITLCCVLLASTITIHSATTQAMCDSLLQEAIDASIKKDHRLSLELLSEAQKIATDNKSQEQLFWILTNIGINYAELLNYSDALDTFFDAYKIALNDLDKRHEMSILNNIAGLYMLDKKYDKAIEYYTTVYNEVKNTPDSLFTGGCAMNIACAMMSTDQWRETEPLIKTAEVLLQNHPYDLLQLRTLQVRYLLMRGEKQRAYRLAQESKILADSLDNNAMKIDTRFALINACTSLNDYPATIVHAKEALTQDVNIEERCNLFRTLAKAYQNTGDYDQAIACKDSVIELSSQIWNLQGKKQFENSSIQFELFKREKEMNEYRIKTRTGIMVLGLSVICAIVLIWALIITNIKNRQQKKIIGLELERERQSQQLLQKQLDEQQAKSQLEEERYQHEIELKDKELMSKAMVMANRNDLICKIIDTMSESEALRKANDTTLKESIRQLRKTLDDSEEWKNFTTYFEQRNDAFINSLKSQYPDLSANEIRFLSLIYINLSTKEIALLLNITPEYCKKKKQQLAKKLGLDSTKALYNYLCRL